MTDVAAGPRPVTQIACPYIGLVPFNEEQQAVFFGRERDTSLLADNLMAYRLTLVYGPSGVGKSSLLAAGVIPTLRRQVDTGFAGAPSPIIVRLNAWRDDPFKRLQEVLAAALATAGHHDEEVPDLTTTSLRDALADLTSRLNAEFFFIFDQFEEYFLYHDDIDDRFGVELGEAVVAAGRRVHFLLAIREDGLAKLDRFQGRIPNLFGNYYRLDPLDLEQARDAITGPLEVANRSLLESEQMQIEPALVDKVLDQVRTGQVQLGTAGEGRLSSPDAGNAIETAHLQLVMTRLWDAERTAGSRVLRVATLDALGGAPSIVRSHLDMTMAALSNAERAIAAQVFRQLVTPSGSKIAHRVDDLAEYAEVPAEQLETVLEKLSSSDLRVLRPVPPPPGERDGSRYEIFHDALAPAILEWRAKAELDEARQEASKERRRRLVLSALAGLLVVALVATVVLWVNTTRESHRRQSEQLASQALTELPADPTLAARTVLEAWGESHTDLAESAMRRIAPEVHVLAGLSGHEAAVRSAVFSPDGTTVLTASDDGTARLWDPETGATQATLEGHTRGLLGARFSHEGEQVVTWSLDRTAILWDARTGEVVAELTDHSWTVFDGVFTPDDSGVVTVSDGIALLWDASTGEELRTFDNGGSFVSSVAFTNRSTELVTGDVDGHVKVWSTESGEMLADMPIPEGYVYRSMYAVTVSADGDVIAAGGRAADLWVWHWRQPGAVGNFLWDESVGLRDTTHIAFSDDGSQLVEVVDTQGYLWTVPVADEFRNDPIPLGGHSDWLTHAVFSRGGEYLITASRDGTAFVREANGGGVLSELRGHSGGINRVDFAPDGRIVTASDDGTARVWEAPAGRVFSGHEDWIIDAEVTPDGDRLASVTADGVVKLWDIESAEQVGADFTVPDYYLGFLNAVAVDPTGRYVAAGSADYWRVWVWDIEGDHGEPVAAFADKSLVSSLAFAPAGRTLAVGLGDGTVHLWDWSPEDATEFAPTITTASGVVFVAWSPDGNRFATAGSDGQVQIWDATTRQEVTAWNAHRGQVWDLAFDADGRRLATVAGDRTARLWDVETSEELAVMRGQDAPLVGVAFSPDGERLVTGAVDGTVGIWATSTGRNLSIVRAHADKVVNWVYMFDDGEILSAGDDNNIRAYPCETCGSADGIAEQLRARLARVPAPARRATAADQAVGSVGPGGCLPELPDGEIDRVAPVSCDSSHHLEVYGLFAVPGGGDAPFPGDDPLFDQATDLCEKGFFEDYVGLPADESTYTTLVLIPTEDSWVTNNDRRVTCMLEHPDGEVVGSARGSGQ